MFSFLSWFQAAGASRPARFSISELIWTTSEMIPDQPRQGNQREVTGSARAQINQHDREVCFHSCITCGGCWCWSDMTRESSGICWESPLMPKFRDKLVTGKASGTAATVNVNRPVVQLCRCGNVSTTCSKKNEFNSIKKIYISCSYLEFTPLTLGLRLHSHVNPRRCCELHRLLKNMTWTALIWLRNEAAWGLDALLPSARWVFFFNVLLQNWVCDWA